MQAGCVVFNARGGKDPLRRAFFSWYFEGVKIMGGLGASTKMLQLLCVVEMKVSFLASTALGSSFRARMAAFGKEAMIAADFCLVAE